VRTLRFAIVLFAYLFFGAISFSTVWHPGIVAARSGIISMCTDTAHNPFARRVLVPSLVKLIDDVTPDALKGRIRQSVAASLPAAEQPAGGRDARLGLSEGVHGHEFLVAVAMFLKYLSLVGFLFALRYAIRVFYAPPEIISDFGALLSLLFLPVFGAFSNFIYDYTQLALFTLCLPLLAKRRWAAYYPILLLLVLNKETAILMPLIFAVAMAHEVPKREYWRHLVAQVGLCTVVTLFLVWAMRDRPGGIVVFHLFANLKSLSSIHSYLDFQKIGPCLLASRGLSVAAPVGLNVLVWLPFFAVMFLFWRQKPRFLRLALPVILIPLAVLTLVYGLVTEIRDLYEAFPVAFLLVFHSLLRIWHVDKGPADGIRPEAAGA
jgi:hypothetical protein